MKKLVRTEGPNAPGGSARKAGALCAIAMLLAACTGCNASGYWGHRARDAADIFTVTVGVGLGAKARVGPAQLGLILNSDTFGLRGGQWVDRHFYEGNSDALLLTVGEERFLSEPGPRGLKAFEATSTFPFVSLADCPEYYTQIEVVLALGGSLRLGFNPGELVDFVLGWTTLDIYGDDGAPAYGEPR